MLDTTGAYMKDGGKRRESWEICQDFAESVAPFGSPDRAVLDKDTINKWVEHLASWDMFFTGTFAREGVSVASASKSFELFCRKFLRQRPAIYFIEGNPTRGDGGHHVHALVESCGCRREGIWELWFQKHGFARVLPITAIGGVAGYCAKLAPYVTKSQVKGGLWWNVLNGHRSQRTLAI